jgi:hypothetical protein
MDMTPLSPQRLPNFPRLKPVWREWHFHARDELVARLVLFKTQVGSNNVDYQFLA